MDLAFTEIYLYRCIGYVLRKIKEVLSLRNLVTCVLKEASRLVLWLLTMKNIKHVLCLFRIRLNAMAIEKNCNLEKGY